MNKRLREESEGDGERALQRGGGRSKDICNLMRRGRTEKSKRARESAFPKTYLVNLGRLQISSARSARRDKERTVEMHHDPFRRKLESADDVDDGERTNDRDESMDVMPSVASLCHCSLASSTRFRMMPLLYGFLSAVELIQLIIHLSVHRFSWPYYCNSPH